MITDFMEFLKKSRGRFAFVATYEFDPLFFERRILATPAFESAAVVIFVDNDRYSDILAAGKQGQGFDRNYFVIPMIRAEGVFHPKLYLAIGDKKAMASVGSNNCTAAGTGHNFELISTTESSSGDDRNANAHLISSIFQQFWRYADEAGPIAEWLKRDIFDQARAAFPWLTDTPGASQSVELLSSHDSGLWPQIVARLTDRTVSKVTLLAPFFGKKLRMVERIRDRWPDAAIEIVSQSGYSNLPMERFAVLRDTLGNIELISAVPQKTGRNMHAKALAFETPECTYWLAGSANMSDAALTGGNSEACLWFATRQTVTKALKHEELTFSRVDPKDFKAVAIEEPKPRAGEAFELKIRSLILTDEGHTVELAENAAQARAARQNGRPDNP